MIFYKFYSLRLQFTLKPSLIHTQKTTGNFILYQVVAPKKIKLGEAQESLSTTMKLLNEKRAELKEVQDRLAELQANFKAATEKKEQLEYQVCF